MKHFLVLALSTAVMIGCSSDDADNVPPPPGTYALVAGATPSFDAGQIELLTAGDMPSSYYTFPATASDIQVRTDGTNTYQVGRFTLDSLTRFNGVDRTSLQYQFSVNGDEMGANPSDIVFASETKAYVPRYGSDKVWIVNPSTTVEAEFKLGELDLSAYDDGATEARDALIVGDRLYILMQRLTGFTPDKTGYVAVFDISTDTEIDTTQGQDGLLGVALNTTNALSLHYLAATNDVLVLGRGNLFDNMDVPGDAYTGGIEAIDVSDNTVSMLIDDGTADNNNGFFNSMVLVNDSLGYLATTAGFQSNTLRSFNPTTGVLDTTVVAGLENQDIGDMAVDPTGRLWVAIGGTEPGFRVIDPADNSVLIERVATELVPLNVVFIEVP